MFAHSFTRFKRVHPNINCKLELHKLKQKQNLFIHTHIHVLHNRFQVSNQNASSSFKGCLLFTPSAENGYSLNRGLRENQSRQHCLLLGFVILVPRRYTYTMEGHQSESLGCCSSLSCALDEGRCFSNQRMYRVTFQTLISCLVQLVIVQSVLK